jgi:hypothetical protein
MKAKHTKGWKPLISLRNSWITQDPKRRITLTNCILITKLRLFTMRNLHGFYSLRPWLLIYISGQLKTTTKPPTFPQFWRPLRQPKSLSNGTYELMMSSYWHHPNDIISLSPYLGLITTLKKTRN